MRGGDVVRCRTTALLVVKLVVTLLQLSYTAACTNTQHCLKLPSYCCTSVSTMSIDIPTHQFIIIIVIDVYTSFLSVPVSISLPYPFVVRSGWRGVREDRGVWSSFTTVPNLTNLNVRTDRRLLTVTVWCRESGLSDEDYLTLVCLQILMWAQGGAVGWGIGLRVRFPMASLEFYMTLTFKRQNFLLNFSTPCV